MTTCEFVDHQVTINLLDENDNSPEFTKDVYSRVMVNSESAGTPVVVVSASDADAPPNNNKTFSIIGGDPNGMFTIDWYSTELGHLEIKVVIHYYNNK